MLDKDALINNLPQAILLLQSQITRNIFDGEQEFSVFYLGNEITALIYERDFDLTESDIFSLQSYQELFHVIPYSSRGYLESRIEEFYTIWIEPVKAELEER